MAAEKTRGSDRTRNWNIIVYPDSAPTNWRDILDDSHIEWIESPLHEFDVNPTGEVKKAHYHVLLLFGGVKSFEQVSDFIQPLNCPIPQRCHNAKSSVRYMAHLDNPDKYQYSISDIVSHGGVDVSELLRPSSSERYSLLRDMCTFIRDNHITEFRYIVDYALENRFDDWFPLLCDNSAYFIKEYIRSCHFEERT